MKPKFEIEATAEDTPLTPDILAQLAAMVNDWPSTHITGKLAKQLIELARKAIKAPYLVKADIEEPVFVLRAHDKHAALFVRRWVTWVENETALPSAKKTEALAVADAMADWRKQKNLD